MRYAIFVYAAADLDTGPGAEEWEAALDRHRAFGAALAEQGTPFSGGGLHSIRSATSLRRRDGELVHTDGPFAETKEQLWGYYDVEAPDLDAVIAMVDGLWELDHGTVEIRPVFPAPEAPAA